MRDDNQDLAVRLDAAKSAAPYIHPKLSNIEHSGNIDLITPEELSDTDLANIALRGRNGASETTISEEKPDEIH
jgi:hypothetical protein